MTKIIYLILLSFPFIANTLSAQQIKRDTVHFNYNNYKVDSKGKKILNKSCDIINNNQAAHITLLGHTDSDGSNEYNLILSKKRSNAVFDYLISKGISKDRITIKYLGEVSPISLDKNENGKQKNRRVEIIIENKNTLIGDIFKKLEKEPQHFKVWGSANIEIKGKEGTIIKIPKDAFEKNASDKVTGEVEISLMEFYSKADILTSNLHTMSNKNILETGGMIYISAYSSGEKLKLKKGVKIEIEFPTRNMENMGIFLGQLQNSHLNWIQQIEDPRYTVSEGNKPVRRVVNEEYYGFEKYGNDSNTVAALRKMDNIILNSNELGWINCDRFLKFNNKTNMIVEMDTTFKPIVRLIFKDINAIMPGYQNIGQQIAFNDIPVGQRATLVAFSLVNNEPYFVSKDILISKDQKENMKLIKTTMSMLNDNLKKLN
jgi:hypothetical protein